MKRLTLAEARELRAIYLVANTPLYLYRHLRRSSTVQRMADEHSAAELAAFVATVDAAERQSAEVVAIAYGCTVAITFKPSGEADIAIDGLAIHHLHWVPQIFSIWKQGRIENSVTRVDLPRIETPSRTTASSTAVRIVYPGGT